MPRRPLLVLQNPPRDKSPALMEPYWNTTDGFQRRLAGRNYSFPISGSSAHHHTVPSLTSADTMSASSSIQSGSQVPVHERILRIQHDGSSTLPHDGSLATFVCPLFFNHSQEPPVTLYVQGADNLKRHVASHFLLPERGCKVDPPADYSCPIFGCPFINASWESFLAHYVQCHRNPDFGHAMTSVSQHMDQDRCINMVEFMRKKSLIPKSVAFDLITQFGNRLESSRPLVWNQERHRRRVRAPT